MNYFPRSYFPSDFFGEALPSSDDPITNTYRGGYFASSYFGGTGAFVLTPAGVLDEPLSDASCLIWIRDRLQSSGYLEWVGIGRTTHQGNNNDYPAAWIYPVGFSESDDVDPYQPTRKLSYAIYLVVKPEDPLDDLASIKALDRLSNQVANLLSGNGPEGCIGALSRVETGKYDVIPLGTRDKPAIGTQTSGIYLFGTVAYLIEGQLGHDEVEF